MHRLIVAACAFVVAAAMVGVAQKRPADLQVPLKFDPQESVRASSVPLAASIIDLPLEIRVEDSREMPDPRTIGSGTDDDDVTFAIRSTSDVVPFVSESVAQVATAQALKKGSPAERVLQLRLTRFNVNETNKAVGSTYLAEVHFAYKLLDREGRTLFEGASGGTASRYGRARSAGNCAEVLSDALKDAFVQAIGDPNLQQAWGSGKSAAPTAAQPTGAQPAAAATGTIEQRLRTLDDLLKKGLITKDEHAARHAAILKEI